MNQLYFNPFTYENLHYIIVTTKKIDKFSDALNGCYWCNGSTEKEAIEILINTIKDRGFICKDINLEKWPDAEIYKLIEHLRKMQETNLELK